jgi:hypothetical protein
MIPRFEKTSGNLPAGTHEATWDEVAARYGYTPHRRLLLAGLKGALDALRLAGCHRAYVDGSFVTAKREPGDFDVCWDVDDVDPDLLDPVLLTFDNSRAAQKAKYHGEVFPANAAADRSGTRYIQFLQRDKRTLQAKGIVALELGELP